MITSKLPMRTVAMSEYPFSEELAALFTFESTFGETVKGAIVDGKTIWVPREAVPYANPPNDFRTADPLPLALNCKPVVWRPEQFEKCMQSLYLLREGKNHIFEAPTGWGKTVAGSWIAVELGQPTMIVVTKDDLVQQWRDSLVHVLGVPTNLIGHVQGDICDWKGKRFVIGMTQSLMIEGKYPLDMFRYFGLVILDEVHQMAAECFVRVCQSFYAKSRIGFSATPKRSDGKTKLLYWNIGPTLVKGSVVALKPKILIRQTGWKIPTRRKLVGSSWEHVPIPYAPGRMMGVIKAMAGTDVRNMEIVNFVLQSYRAGRITLVMSDLRETHLNRLFQMLAGEGIPGNEIGYYVGGMAKHELTATKNRKVVLATYKMCSTGTDVPHWDTLVMATPRANVKQSVGRIMRVLAGKKQPVILDLVDKNAIFQSFHLSRLKQYYELGAEVVKVA